MPQDTRGSDALAGVAAVAVALGAGEAISGLLGLPSPVVSIGTWVVEHVPGTVERTAIALFGTADKLVLNIGIIATVFVLGAVVGVVARRRPALATGVFVLFAVAAALAVAARPDGALPLAIVVLGLAAAAGLGTLRVLHRLATPPVGRLVPDLDAGGTRAIEEGDPEVAASRRRFLGWALAAVAVAAVGGTAGRWWAGRTMGLSAAGVELPDPAEPARAPGPSEAFEVDGLTPVVVPNPDFYRIDTALVVPRVDASTWRLRVTGMVDRELELTYDDLLSRRLVERYVTIACVSNEVGGGLVGNAAWLGVPLDEVLDEAGVHDGATQIVGRSVDDWTAGFPTEAAFDGRGALIAVGMNGEPLPLAHGFPARLIVPGLYGYVSATKWLEQIELTTWDGFDAYWVPRGWAKEGPIHTQSRIDVPRGRVGAGTVNVAGVAWAPNVGIERVEVRVDEGPWEDAELSEPLSDDAWRQWRYPWPASAGRHRLQVRATDRAGRTQTEQRTAPFPDGATGYHTVSVQVA